MIPVEPTAEVPIPFDTSDEEPKTHKDAIAAAVNTAGLIGELGGSIDFKNADLHQVKKLVSGEGKSDTPKHINSPSEAAAAHAIIKQYDFAAFADILQARNFITNKLVKLADCGDPKLELKALELLGKHSDIGLFTERSEITINHTSASALENSIKERVKRLLNAQAVDITPRMIDELDGLDVRRNAAAENMSEKRVDETQKSEHVEAQEEEKPNE